MSTTIITVDAKGQSCPGPLVSLAKAIKDAPQGTTFELLASHTRLAHRSVPRSPHRSTALEILIVHGAEKREDGAAGVECTDGIGRGCRWPRSGTGRWRRRVTRREQDEGAH